MSKTKFTTILIIITLLINSKPIPSSLNYSEKIYSTKIYTLAVSENDRGFVIEVVFNVYYPGRGLVIIDNPSRVSEDTVLSIEYSIIYASIICGVDYRLYDYEFVFPENTRVRGLSGTLAFLLAVLSFYRGLETRSKHGVTGIVYPNFIIGLVEKIQEKYIAGLSYGLDEIIGPYKSDLLNYTKYYPVTDIFNAFLKYSGVELFNNSIELNNTIFEKHYSVTNSVFKESYENWSNLINNLLNEINKTMSLTNYYETEAYKLLELSNKYANKNKWYTASTYAFRSYYVTYKYYLKKLFEINNTFILNKIINELESEIIENLDYLNTILQNYSNRVLNLWDLDAYLNSYIRYYISLKLFTQTYSSNLSMKIEVYPLVLSRIITSLTWLKLLDYKINTGYLIDWKTYRFTVDLLKNYLEKTINYLNYLNLLSNDEKNELYSVVSSTGNRDVNTLVNYTIILYEVSTILYSLSSNIFTDHLDEKVINYLNKSIDLLMKHIYGETNSIIPSLITTIELTNIYLLENTSLSIILSLYLNEYSVLLPILTLIHIDNIIESSYSREQNIPVTEQVYTKPVLETTIALLIITISIGTFLLGYTIGRISRKLTNEIK